MNQKQINRKEMHESTLMYLDNNAEKWSSIAKVGEFKTEFSSLNIQIDEAMKSQADAQVYLSKNKTELKLTIANKADVLNDALEVMADLSGNKKLAQQMSDSKTSLFRLRNQEFIVRIQLIVEKALAYKEILINEYGATKEQITDLQTNTDEFLNLNGMPRAYRVASVVATQDLELLFEKAHDILSNKLDRVMKIFQHRDLNFYNGYLAARTIIDN